MMKNKLLTILFFLFILPPVCRSQGDDFGIWYGLNANYSVIKKLEIDASAMIRTFKDASKIDQSYFEAGVSYKLSKHFSVAGSYRILNKLENYGEYFIRHKFFADVKVSLPIKNFSLTSRFRLDVEKKTFIESFSDKVPNYHGRIKVKLSWKIPKFPVDPYIADEPFMPLTGNREHFIDKNRFSLGADYKISKKHAIELEYIFQRDYTPHIADMDIISIGYTFSL